MKFVFAAALLFSGLTLPAAGAGEEEEEFNLPVPAVPAQPPGDKKAPQLSEGAAVPGKKVPLNSCDTIEKKIAARAQKNKKGFKKVSWNDPDTPAVKEKKRQIAASEDKALELCRLTRAQRAKAEKLKAAGSDDAAAGNMRRQANLLEKTAEEFFLKAKKLREELDPPPALKRSGH